MMTGIKQLALVSIFLKNQKRAKDFYSRKLGLKIREHWPDFKYLSMGSSKDGADAGLAIWEPGSWGITGAKAKKMIGGFTGLGFATAKFEQLERKLAKSGVQVQRRHEDEGFRYMRVWDPDGNVIFVYEDRRARGKAGGVGKLGFATVASRNSKRLGQFYTRKLGLKRTGHAGWPEYIASPRGTTIMPFTVRRSNYDSAKEYRADLAAIGEDTHFMFACRGLAGLEQRLRKRRVKFRSGTTQAEWGGKEATILDPDGNSYILMQPQP